MIPTMLTGKERHLLLLGAFDDVVCSCILVGGNEVGVVDARQWHHLLHVRHQLSLQVIV